MGLLQRLSRPAGGHQALAQRQVGLPDRRRVVDLQRERERFTQIGQALIQLTAPDPARSQDGQCERPDRGRTGLPGVRDGLLGVADGLLVVGAQHQALGHRLQYPGAFGRGGRTRHQTGRFLVRGTGGLLVGGGQRVAALAFEEYGRTRRLGGPVDVKQGLGHQGDGPRVVPGGGGRLGGVEQELMTRHTGRHRCARGHRPHPQHPFVLDVGRRGGTGPLREVGRQAGGRQCLRGFARGLPVPGQLRRVGRRIVRRRAPAVLERPGGAAVQPGTLAGQHRAEHRLLRQLVTETVAVGRRHQQEVVHRLAQRLLQYVVRETGDGGEQQVVAGAADHGGRTQHLSRGGSQPGEAGVQRIAHGRRKAAGPAVGGEQFLGEEGVPLRPAEEVVHEGRGGALPEEFAHLPLHLGTGQRRQPQPVHLPVAGQFGEQCADRMAGDQLVAPHGDDQQDGVLAQYAGEEREQVTGGPVGPVQVLDDRHGGLALSGEQIRDPAEEASAVPDPGGRR